MKRIYKLSEKVSDRMNLNESTVFIIMNTLFWGIAAAICLIPLCSLFAGSEESLIKSAICAMGYPAVFIGFFGAVIYIMRNN